MIIIVCTDDPSLVSIAQESINENPNIFGDYYKVFDENIPQINANENLFIIAHGAFKGDDHNPVIGDQSGNRAFYLNAVDLFNNIKRIFPFNYEGNIFVDACESAIEDPYTFSFISTLQGQIQANYPSVVYGRNGSPSGLIPTPNSKGWTRAGWKLNQTQTDGVLASGGTAKTPVTPLPKISPYNVQAKKYYVFNETGNIMLASTADQSAEIKKSVRNVFAEVSVFFAAMTKAISTTVNPKATPAGTNYSLYDYNAISDIIDGSGLFIHVTEEDINYYTESVGIEFSKELIEATLGLATGEGELAFAQAMISSMGSAGIKIGQQSSSSKSTVANIVFVCEYLLGMPIVSAIVANIEIDRFSQQFSLGPCINENSSSYTWKIHKDTYMFVTPDFIRKYSSDLMTVETDPDYKRFVNDLRGLINKNLVVVNGVQTTGAHPATAPLTLVVGTTYAIGGENFGTTQGTLVFGTATCTVVSWDDTTITFKVSGTQATSVPIIVKTPGANTSSTPTPSSYKI